MSEPPYAKIVLTTVAEDGTMVETPWAIGLSADLYRLDNVPFYAYGVSLHDVVEATAEPGNPQLHFRRVVEKSGNRTIRVLAADGAAAVSQGVLDGLVRLGCSYEGATPRYICINIPPATDLASVVAFLESTGLKWEHADPTYDQLHAAR
jgi:hypothetical protein